MSLRAGRPINLIFIILLIFLGIVLLYGQQTSTHPSSTTSDYLSELRPNVPLFNKWSSCMAQRVFNESDHKTFWAKFQIWTDECDDRAEIDQLNLVPLKNSDETKFGLLPVETDPIAANTNLVTLGIGKDIDAEVLYRQKMNEIGRNISFYGADPITEVNADLYAKIGKYFPFAVGSDAGYSSASVYVNGTYFMRDVVHVDLIYFFDRILKMKTFDNIWLDAEGAEYPLFDIFQKTGRLERKGIKFCQMSLEVHSPSEPQQIQFMELIKQIIKEFRYGMHKNRNVGHMRMYLFNFGDSYCVRKYLSRNLYELMSKDQREEIEEGFEDNLMTV